MPQKHTFNQLLSCRTKNIEHAPQPSTHEDVYIRGACKKYIYIYEFGRGETEKKDLGEGGEGGGLGRNSILEHTLRTSCKYLEHLVTLSWMLLRAMF